MEVHNISCLILQGIVKEVVVEDQWHLQLLVIEVEVEVCRDSKMGEEVLYQRP